MTIIRLCLEVMSIYSPVSYRGSCEVVASSTFWQIYGRNQSGCEKDKKMGFLPSILWVFLTIYISFALMKITMCFKHLEESHIMSCDS